MNFTTKIISNNNDNETDYESSDLSDIISSNDNETDYDSSDLSDIFSYNNSLNILDNHSNTELSNNKNIYDINNKQYKNFINEDNKSVIFTILKNDINKNNYPSLNNPYIDVFDDDNFVDYYRPSKNTLYEKYKCLYKKYKCIYEKYEHAYLNTIKSVSRKLFSKYQKPSLQKLDKEYCVFKDLCDKESSIIKDLCDEESLIINNIFDKIDLINNDDFNLLNEKIIDIDFSCIIKPITLEKQINPSLDDENMAICGQLFSTPKIYSHEFFDPLNYNNNNNYYTTLKKRKYYKRKFLKYKKLLLKVCNKSYLINKF